MARLLVLRAQPDAEHTATEIERLGHRAILAPLRQAEAVFGDPPAKPDFLVATSANALRLGAPIPEDWRALPLFCVGERSAALAEGMGFGVIRPAGHVAALIDTIRGFEIRNARLVYLAGEPRRSELEAAFAGRIAVWLRYRMVDFEKLPDIANQSLIAGDCDAILHFSMQSARRWLGLAQAAGLLAQALAPVQACISVDVAALIRGEAQAAGLVCRIVVAKHMQGHSVVSAALDAVSAAPGLQMD